MQRTSHPSFAVRTWLAVLLLVIQAAAARAAPLELVYSMPSECSLAQPLRNPQAVWSELFDQAKRSIDIEQMYLTHKPGAALEPVVRSLRRAAARGVRVRVLVEEKMLKASQPTVELLRGFPNTEVRVLKFSQLGGGVIHAKLLIIDGQRAYVGSQNFDWRALAHIHELGLRIDDAELAAQLQALFTADWTAQAALAAGQQVPPLREERPQAALARAAYLVASPYNRLPPGIGDSESELVRLLGTAQRRLQIQLLTYAPLSHGSRQFYPVIDNALRAAVARGVSVELLVSDWNTDRHRIDWLKSLSVLPRVQVRVVTIPPAKEGFIDHARVIHSKYMVLDDTTLWLGTSNWEGGYLDNSRNVEVVSKDAALAAQAAALHGQLWNSPYATPLDVKKEYTPPRIQ